jgi:hypothetical protein
MAAATRAKVLKRLEKIAGADRKAKDAVVEYHETREVIAAIRALVQIDRLNLEAAMFEHQTRPIEEVDDDYEIDLGKED